MLGMTPERLYSYFIILFQGRQWFSEVMHIKHLALCKPSTNDSVIIKLGKLVMVAQGYMQGRYLSITQSVQASI